LNCPRSGKLSDENRWVIMANLIPWEKFEEEYAKSFCENKGAPALPFRVAMSALIIQESYLANKLLNRSSI